MTRRKSEITARMNERDYPHIVELPVPPGAFEQPMTCWRSTASATFKSVAARGAITTVNPTCTYCFADAVDADAFRNQFGGERQTVRQPIR
jgi:hypothetical protein